MAGTTVQILYKYVDGAHFFVSNGEMTLGLCVAHKDAEIAYNSVSAQLNVLFKENHGFEAPNFQPSLSTPTFLQWLEAQTDAALSGSVPGVAGVVSWIPGSANQQVA